MVIADDVRSYFFGANREQLGGRSTKTIAATLASLVLIQLQR